MKKKYRVLVSYIDYAMYDVESDSPDDAELAVFEFAKEEGLERAQTDTIFEYLGEDLPEGWEPYVAEEEQETT